MSFSDFLFCDGNVNCAHAHMHLCFFFSPKACVEYCVQSMGTLFVINTRLLFYCSLGKQTKFLMFSFICNFLMHSSAVTFSVWCNGMLQSYLVLIYAPNYLT